MQIGGYSIRLLEGGRFWLDGGGMFGVVPRTMWQERIQPDGQNRIRLSCTCVLVEGHGRRVLIESGTGDKWNDKDAGIYGIEDRGGILASLRAGGIDPASINAVFCSHLHFDHGGGLTTLGADSRPRLSFPNARVYVQRREWQDATANLSHMRTTYRPENIAPLAEAGVVVPLDGAADVLPGIRVEPAPGHTLGSQAIFVGDDQGTLCFIGDVLPTRFHLRPYWTMAYDVQPMTVNETRAKLVARAIAGQWVVVLPHDPLGHAGRVRQDEKGRWAWEAVGE
ncbi:MAG: MBL fold metallo-hydrolase [Phycisphaerae bacterium]|nr:MBL fold metallo-hydrolase [Phycisphaerae bacterium]